MGTDSPGARPLKVGDTLTSVTGAVKRMRGSYGRKGQARGKDARKHRLRACGEPGAPVRVSCRRRCVLLASDCAFRA